ncbi:unnamed protein product [Rotaria socialis]|uniref:G-protein coupled receptor n=2 Tax=Rotaria socialis TaxID=392032 RepID=A0A817UBV7_9BILA|nr:unnamed protein product [Rotaria socialis]
MVFNIVIYLFYLIQFSFGNECPSFKYCICSSDQTIVQCSNRHLTNELLLKINNQLPKSTIVLNLSSNSLTSIKYLPNLNSLQILDLSFNKIKYLPSNILSKFPRLISFDLQNNSLKAIPHTFQKISNINLNLSNNRFHCTCQFKLFKTKNFFKSILCQNNKQFDENDFCRAKNFLQIYPQQSQIVYENEQFILNCSSNLQHYWTLNHTFYPSTITSFSYSTVIIHHVRTNHSGLWTCHSLDSNQSLWLTVITTPTTYFCPSKQMNTSKGYFYWPRTLMNRRVAKTCPHGTAAWLRNSNEYARAWYTCSSSGQWINFDVSQCAFQTNVSRLMDYLSFNETNVLLRLSKYLSEINQNYLQLNDIILLIDLIDEQKQKYQHQDKIIIIYHLTDFILQIKNDFIYSNEYQNAMGRLRSIIERLLDFTNPSWLYIGKELTAVTVQSLVSCAVPNRSLLTIICNIDHQSHQSQLVTIQFSSDSNKTEQYSLFRIIVYRQSTLFTPNTVGMNNNPVVYIRPVSRNVLSTINLTFYGQSDKSSIGVWYSNQSNWEMNSSICKIDRQDANFTSTNCILLNNDSLSVTYFNNINNSKKLLIYTNYSQLPIYISSIIGSICFFISILVCTCYSEVYQMSRSVFHCLINYWLSLGILLPLFAFGLQKNQLKLLCEFIALTLHYLCLTTIIWLTLLTYAIWSKQSIKSTNKDAQRQSSSSMINDHASKMKSKSKPVIQFYLLAYGTALIICCMNIAVSHQHYMINDICFFNDFYSILILIISIFIFIFLLLFFLLSTHNRIRRLKTETNHSDISRIKNNNMSLSKSNEVSAILKLSNQNNEYILANMNDQHESINQLLSILFQLILLIFLLLSSLAIYLHPLKLFKLRFEHFIYGHLYGGFVLILSFYILSFYVLLNFDLIRRYYSKCKKSDHPSEQSYVERPAPSINTRVNYDYDVPSFAEENSMSRSSPSNCSSCANCSKTSQNLERISTGDSYIDDAKHLTIVGSENYVCRRHVINTDEINSSLNILHKKLPRSSFDVLLSDNDDAQQFENNSFNEEIQQNSVDSPIEFYSGNTKNTQFQLFSTALPRSCTHPKASSAQAIIRVIPIIHFSTSNINGSLSNSSNTIQPDDQVDLSIEQNELIKNARISYSIPASSFANEYDPTYFCLNKTDNLIQQKLSSNEKLSNEKKTVSDHAELAYIDQDDDLSVSLKSSFYESIASLNTLINKNDYPQTLSYASNLSDELGNGVIHANKNLLNESSV